MRPDNCLAARKASDTNISEQFSCSAVLLFSDLTTYRDFFRLVGLATRLLTAFFLTETFFATFLATFFEVARFLVTAFLAGDFFAATFFATDFLAATLRVVVFLAAFFLTLAFLVVVFLAATFFDAFFAVRFEAVFELALASENAAAQPSE